MNAAQILADHEVQRLQRAYMEAAILWEDSGCFVDKGDMDRTLMELDARLALLGNGPVHDIPPLV